MAVNNFIPTMWSSMIQEILRKQLVFGALTNRDYEGEISQKGDSVRINSIGPVTVGDYVKNVTNVTPETLNDQSQVLQIDQSKYFSFEVDDIDKRQTTGGLLVAGMSDAAYRLADTLDQYIASLYTDAGSTTADTPVNSVNVLATVLTASQALSDGNCPRDGRVMIIPPWFTNKLVLAEVLLPATNQSSFGSGFVGRVAGFNVFESNNVADDGAGNDQILCGTSRAITLAEQINSVEAYRPEGAFSDAVKGLHLYGARVVQPDCLTVISCSELAEP